MACVENGTWQPGLCVHGACDAAGKCVCSAGYRDDSYWIGGFDCFLDTRLVQSLLVLNLVLGVLALASLLHVMAWSGKASRTMVQQTVRMGVVSLVCYCTWAALNLFVFEQLRPACAVLLMVAGNLCLHIHSVYLTIMLRPVEAVSETDAKARGLQTAVGRRYFVWFVWTYGAATSGAMIAQDHNGDAVALAEARKRGGGVYLVALTYLICLLLCGVLLYVRVANAVERLNQTLRTMTDPAISGAALDETEVRKMRALKNRVTASLWVISVLVAGFSTAALITFAYSALYGVFPYSSVWLLASAPVVPGFQMPVIIAARKDVKFWASRSRTSFARKIFSKIAPLVADDSAPEPPAGVATRISVTSASSCVAKTTSRVAA
jgi:hypothetical protein